MADKKTERIILRITLDEKKELEKQAQKEKINLSSFIRSKIFEKNQKNELSESLNKQIEIYEKQVEYLQTENIELRQNKKETNDNLQKILATQSQKIELLENNQKKSWFQKIFKR